MKLNPVLGILLAAAFLSAQLAPSLCARTSAAGDLLVPICANGVTKYVSYSELSGEKTPAGEPGGACAACATLCKSCSGLTAFAAAVLIVFYLAGLTVRPFEALRQAGPIFARTKRQRAPPLRIAQAL